MGLKNQTQQTQDCARGGWRRNQGTQTVADDGRHKLLWRRKQRNGVLELDLVYGTQKVLGLLKRVGCMSYEVGRVSFGFFLLRCQF